MKITSTWTVISLKRIVFLSFDKEKWFLSQKAKMKKILSRSEDRVQYFIPNAVFWETFLTMFSIEFKWTHIFFLLWFVVICYKTVLAERHREQFDRLNIALKCQIQFFGIRLKWFWWVTTPVLMLQREATNDKGDWWPMIPQICWLQIMICMAL